MPEFTEFAEQAKHVAESMKDSRDSAENLHLSVSKLITAAGGFRLIEWSMRQFVEHSKLAASVQSVISKENLIQSNLAKRRDDIIAAYEKKLSAIAKANILDTEEAHRSLNIHRLELKAVSEQEKFAESLKKLGEGRLLLGVALVGIAGDLVVKNKELNQNLIEANSSYQTRWNLLYRTLLTQSALGISFNKATEAARSLVHYGLDTEASYAENVKIVSQMEQGLGVSTHAAAELATVVERQVKGSFKDVADVVASLVNDTALAGDEATKLANSIAQVMGRLKPGLGAAGLPEVVRLVGRYESALKEVGGAPGGFQQLLQQLTTTQGLTGAGILRVSPDFLTTSRGVQQVMQNFAEYGKRFVGETRGWERQMRLEVLASQFNISAEQASQMLMAVERANNRQTDAITLQERWRQQVAATDQGVGRLSNALISLVQGALYPFLFVINAIANRAADLINAVLQYREVAIGFMAAVGVGVVALGSRMILLARQMWIAVLSSNAVTAAMQRMSAAMAAAAVTSSAGGAAGGLAGAGRLMLGWLRPLFGLLINPLTWIALAVGAIALYAAKILKITADAKAEDARSRQIVLDRQSLLEQRRMAALYREARLGTVSGASKQLDELISYASMKFTKEMFPDPNQRIAEMQKWVAEQERIAQIQLARGVAFRQFAAPLVGRTKEEEQHDDAMLNVVKDHSAATHKQLEMMKRSMDQDTVSTQQHEVEAAKTAARWYDKIPLLDTAGDYWVDKLTK
jgi:hypothetical protein